MEDSVDDVGEAAPADAEAVAVDADGSAAETLAADGSTDEGIDPTDRDVDTLLQETVGDGRPKHVELVTDDGERIERGDVYIRYSAELFLVSADPEFPENETEVYPKADLHRAHVDQHHSACFITTAVAGESETLSALRGFRDDAMTPTLVGGGLVAIYERISPPIAATLSAHPGSRTTRTVRRLVRRCAALARRRETATGVSRGLHSMALVLLYVFGLCVAAGGAAVLGVGGDGGKGRVAGDDGGN